MKLKRLLDEPGSDLDRVLLEAGLDEAPPAKSIDRTLAAIGIGSALTLGASATATVTATAASSGGSGVALAKTGGLLGVSMGKWIGGALLAAGTIGGYVGLRGGDAAEPPPAPAGRNAPLVAGAASEGAAPRAANVARGGESAAPTDAAPADETASGASPGPAPLRGGSDEPIAKRDHAASSSDEPVKSAAKAKPTEKPLKPAATTKPVATTKPKPADPPDTVSGTGLTAETALLDGARKALAAGDADGCLARLATYASRFPKGQLAPDAAGMRAAALKKKNDAAAPSASPAAPAGP